MILRPEVIAHRGLARLYPENTLGAALGALDAGLRFVEIDVQMSADRVPIVYHDPTLSRVSGRGGDVRDLSWARLERLPAHEPARFGRFHSRERICSLDKLARSLARRGGSATLFVELKEESLLRFGRASMLSAVDRALAPIRRRSVLISFDEPVLELARRATRYHLGAVLRDTRRLRSDFMRALKPDIVFCDVKLLPRKGSLKRALGMNSATGLAVYEVPDVASARALAARGVDLIETFRADSLRQEISRWR